MCIGKIMQITLPEKVKQIITRLSEAGYEAYAVGGCVRDSMLGREPGDWDITTSATPLQVKALFRRTVDTGIKHGTVTVLLGGDGFEVTTYRIDGEYRDFRHPKEVVFTSSLAEDLNRRDFTINAMAYNDGSGLVDLFGGASDLENGIIRCVGNAAERFSEDALRMLRAVRFSAQLGFAIDEDTKRATMELAPNLANISAERIQAEFVKILTSPNPVHMRIAYELGITKIILPEIDAAFLTAQNNPHHIYNVGEHLFRTLLNVPNDKCLRIAALLHDIGKPASRITDDDGIDHFYGHAEISVKMAVKILRRLKFDNDTLHRVRIYIEYHDYDIAPQPKAVRRFLNMAGEEHFDGILKLKYADCLAQSEYEREEKLEWLRKIEEVYRKIIEERQCVSLKDLAVTGSDLIKLGVPQGKKVGEILSTLLEDVLCDPSHNERDYLLEKAKMLT